MMLPGRQQLQQAISQTACESLVKSCIMKHKSMLGKISQEKQKPAKYIWNKNYQANQVVPDALIKEKKWSCKGNELGKNSRACHIIRASRTQHKADSDSPNKQ
jgi:hypothetical protein